MKRRILILLLLFAAIVSAFFIPQIQTILSNRLRLGMRLLSRTAYASYITDLPWSGHIFSRFSNLAAYHDANLSLAPYARGRVIFFGDSITENWAALFPSEFFPGKPYIARGIGGQTTGQMIWRFHQDVIELHPDAVVLLAGTNDIAFHRPLSTATEKSIETMVEMAQRHQIRAILCAVPPISALSPTEQTYEDSQIALFNGWLRSYAAQQHLPYVDYYTALTDSSGRMASSFTSDGIHPNIAGYAVMQPLAQQAIDSLPNP